MTVAFLSAFQTLASCYWFCCSFSLHRLLLVRHKMAWIFHRNIKLMYQLSLVNCGCSLEVKVLLLVHICSRQPRSQLVLIVLYLYPITLSQTENCLKDSLVLDCQYWFTCCYIFSSLCGVCPFLLAFRQAFFWGLLLSLWSPFVAIHKLFLPFFSIFMNF